jgi:hypothetical protein
MRRRYPEAAIIRRLGIGHYVAFNNTYDALDHYSAVTVGKGYSS